MPVLSQNTSTFAVILGLSSEGPLVDLALLGPGEGQAVGLEFEDGFGRFLAHVVDGVLIAEPVAPLHSIIGVPPPVVLVHVAQRGVDSALRSHRVRPGGEQLRNAGSLEALLDQSESGPETGSSSADHHCVESMVNNSILLEESILCVGEGTSASLERCWFPMTLKLNWGAEVILKALFANNFSM
jgi:hypothetical protein